jgi:hypothetical protein
LVRLHASDDDDKSAGTSVRIAAAITESVCKHMSRAESGKTADYAGIAELARVLWSVGNRNIVVESIKECSAQPRRTPTPERAIG